MRIRRHLAIAATAVLALTGCYGDTESAENVTTTTATLMAWGVPQTTATDVYFDYSTTDHFSPETTKKSEEKHPAGLTVGQTYPIAIDVAGLPANTRHWYRMCGKEQSETAYKCAPSIRSFITSTFANPPTRAGSPYTHADIKAVHIGSTFYGTGTGCELTKSANGTTWTKVTDVCGTGAGQHPANMVVAPGPGRVTFWGTEVHKVDRQWIAVTSGNRVYPGGVERGAIWVATATSAAGPWTWRDEAIAMDANDTLIDPSIFADPGTGKKWLTWTRQHGWSGSAGTNELVAQELDPADLTKLLPDSSPTVLLSTDVQPQDREAAYGRRIVEGQGVFTYAGKYYLHYGAGNYTYDTGGGGQPYTFNITDGMDAFPGRFTKQADPTLRGGNGWRHPGHGSVLVDGGGNPWAAVSPWKDGDNQNRYVFVQKMTFNHAPKTFSVYNGVLKTGQIGVPTPHALSLEPGKLQQIKGPTSAAEFHQWLQAMHDWRATERARFGYNPANYARPELAWAQRNPIQPQVMVEDRYLYDVSTRRYTVDRYLADVRARYGGIDSVLIWPMYPNIGVDNRNTLEMIHDMPGGIAGVRQMVRDFQAQGVKVLFPHMASDNGTHYPGGQPTGKWEQVLPPAMAELEADGLNGDTMSSVPKPFFDNSVVAGRPLVLEPELGLGSYNGNVGEAAGARTTLGWNLQTWGYWNTWSDVPMVSVAKWLEPRHTVHVNSRWSTSKIDMLQSAFFNGTGMASWENVWGIWNQVSDRDGDAIRRVATIERRFPELLVSADWEPHTPTAQVKVFASKWPVGSRTMWTLINRDADNDKSGNQLVVSHTAGVRYYDLWNGVELQPSISGSSATLAFPIERRGFGAVLATPGETAPGFDAFLAQMRQWAQRRLDSFSAANQVLSQSMTPVPATQRYSSAPPGMIRIPGAQFPFNVRGTEIEGGSHPPMNVQYPWEALPNRYHSRMMAVPSFYIDRTPVTNAQFKAFVDTGYRPADRYDFLKDWDWTDSANPTYPAGAANRPVTWVSIEDARAYATWAKRRLPHGWEWQYAAQGLDGRLYPWGNAPPDAARVPAPFSDRGDMRPPDDVAAHPTGASPFGVLDLVGNVWQWTDEFKDEHTRSAILRGGSYYQAINSPWYFPSNATAYRLDHHNRYLMMSPGRDRAATIGFRTAADSNEAPPATPASSEIRDAHAPDAWWHSWKSQGWQFIDHQGDKDALHYGMIGGTGAGEQWAERPFYGTGVEVYGPRRPDGGVVRITVDGQPAGGPVNLSTPVLKHHQLLGRVVGLPEGRHTVRVERDPGTAAGKWTGLDYLRVHSPIEAEQLPISTSKPYVVQNDCCGVQWSQGKQVWFQATGPGDTYTVTFNVTEKRPYNLTLIYAKAPDFGVQTRTLDGKPLGKALNHRNPGGVVLHRELHTFWEMGDLSAGQHQLTFTVTGKDPESPRYGFGLDAIILDPAT